MRNIEDKSPPLLNVAVLIPHAAALFCTPSFLTEPGRLAALAPMDSIMVKNPSELDTTSV